MTMTESARLPHSFLESQCSLMHALPSLNIKLKRGCLQSRVKPFQLELCLNNNHFMVRLKGTYCHEVSQ